VTLPRLGITTLSIRLTFLICKSGKRKYEGLCREFGESKIRRIRFEIYFGGSQETESSFIVDNTVASPYLLNPIEHGATIVIHSLTKYTGNGTR
jgi:O-acetylhomoserine (thiol)-lyase